MEKGTFSVRLGVEGADTNYPMPLRESKVCGTRRLVQTSPRLRWIAVEAKGNGSVWFRKRIFPRHAGETWGNFGKAVCFLM